MPTHARARQPYVPSVQPRALRSDGLLKLTPDYPDPSDTKTDYYTQAAATTRATVLTPTTGKRIRIVNLRLISRPNNTTSVVTEFYFGTGADIDAAGSTPISAFLTTGNAEQSKAWTRGQGPKGAIDEVFSTRQNTLGAGGFHDLITEYTEER